MMHGGRNVTDLRQGYRRQMAHEVMRFVGAQTDRESGGNLRFGLGNHRGGIRG